MEDKQRKTQQISIKPANEQWTEVQIFSVVQVTLKYSFDNKPDVATDSTWKCPSACVL